MSLRLLVLILVTSSVVSCSDDEPARDGTSPPGGPVTLPERAAERGISFSVDRAEVEDWFMPESIGCGCAVFDADGDGDLDVYVVSGWRGPDGTVDPSRGGNRLWLQGPKGTFTDATASSGLGDGGYGMGVAIGDIDNDSDLDVYVTNYGPDRLYRNDGEARFTDVTESAGIDSPEWGASAGFCDLDGDGWLDLFVTNYVNYDPARHVGRDPAGRPEYMGPETLKGVPDRLYRGIGRGKFKDVSGETGIRARGGRGLGLAFLDLNGDGRLDVYVANDREANFAWITKADGTFEERGLRLRVAVNERGAPEASMGVAVGDVDGDGLLDLLVTHLVTETHTLYRQVSKGAWRDVTPAWGLGAATRNDTGWGCAFVDLDHDGDNDLACVNGRVIRGPVADGAPSTFWSRYSQRNRVFFNDGAGKLQLTAAASFTTLVESGRGLATGDTDGDGDTDLVVSTANGTLRLFENEVEKHGRWLRVRAWDPERLRDVEGAVITVRCAGRSRVVACARTGSYLSSSSPVAHFGLPSEGPIEAISVRWPDGKQEVFAPAGPGQVLVLERGKGR